MFRSFLAVATAATFAHAAVQDYDGTTCMNKDSDSFYSMYSLYGSTPEHYPKGMSSMSDQPEEGFHASKSCKEEVSPSVTYEGARIKCEWDCTSTDKYVQGEKITSESISPTGMPYFTAAYNTSSPKSELDTDIIFAVSGCDPDEEGSEFGNNLNKYPLKGECSYRVGYKDDGSRSGSALINGDVGFLVACTTHPEHGKSGDDDAVCDFKCSKAQCTISYGFFDAFSDGELGGLIVGVCFWLACIYAVPKWARMRNPDASKIKWGLLGGCCGIFAFACVPCFAKKKKADPNSTEMQATA